MAFRPQMTMSLLLVTALAVTAHAEGPSVALRQKVTFLELDGAEVLAPASLLLQCGDSLLDSAHAQSSITFQPVPPVGTCTIWWRRPGASFRRAQFTLPLPSPLALPFEDQPPARIVMRVAGGIDATDLEIAIRWQPEQRGSSASSIHVPTKAVDLRYNAADDMIVLDGLQPGVYSLDVSLKDREVLSYSALGLAAGQEHDLGELHLRQMVRQCGSLEGFVGGSPATVYWTPGEGADQQFLSASPNGRFCLPALPLGSTVEIVAQQDTIPSEPEIFVVGSGKLRIKLPDDRILLCQLVANGLRKTPESLQMRLFMLEEWDGHRHPVRGQQRTLVVDSRGMFQISLPALEERLVIFDASCCAPTALVLPGSLASGDILRVELQPTSRISGRILDEVSGAPLDQARTTLMCNREDIAWRADRTSSDSRGDFELAGPPNSPCLLRVHADGYRPWEREVRVAPGEDLHVDVELTSGQHLRGFLVDGAQGEPIENAHVRVIGREGAENLRTTTEANGAFIIAGLPEGKLTLVAGAPGYREKVTVIESGDLLGEPVWVSLQRGTPWSGRILSPRGTHGVLSVELISGGERYHAAAAADGTFWFDAGPVGTVGFLVEGDQPPFFCSGLIEVPEHGSTEPIALDCRGMDTE